MDKNRAEALKRYFKENDKFYEQIAKQTPIMMIMIRIIEAVLSICLIHTFFSLA